MLKKLTIVAAALALGVSGCTSASRTLGKLTANKYAEPRSGTVWIVAPPELEPPAPGAKTVYISFRNISDAAEIDLTDLIRNAAREEGWQIVSNPNSAKYRLRGTLRFFGEVEAESGGANVQLGNIAGAAVAGIATAGAINAVTNNRAAIAGGGAIVGALVAQGLANASRPREWALITDFVLEEYSARPVTFELATEDASARRDVGGAASARNASGGGQSRGNTSVATSTRTSNYFPHGIRLSTWANQMNMREDEALPLIEERIERVVTQMLPA
ncbi:MAG: complement resistance protein TraT [Pseudomonadota bacterium]